MTFMEEAWVSNSKMYLLHGSVEYWILIGLCAVKYYCIIIAGLYNVPGNSWPGFMCHSTVKMVISIHTIFLYNKDNSRHKTIWMYFAITTGRLYIMPYTTLQKWVRFFFERCLFYLTKNTVKS